MESSFLKSVVKVDLIVHSDIFLSSLNDKDKLEWEIFRRKMKLLLKEYNREQTLHLKHDQKVVRKKVGGVIR
jgi:hypothetical protein